MRPAVGFMFAASRNARARLLSSAPLPKSSLRERISTIYSKAVGAAQRMLRRTNLAAAEARKPLLDPKSILKDVLHGHSSAVLLGFSLGGLFSSVMTVLYLKAEEHRRTAKGEPVENGYELPHPKLASFGWTLLGAFATVSIGMTRTHLKHALKHFVEHVNFSLNMLRNGKFSFRTIHETHIADIFRDNERAGAILIAAARQTSAASPFILLPPKERRYLATSIINTLSPIATPGFFALERGQPVSGGWYRLALTFEDDIPDEKARKIRVLIASEDMLSAVNKWPAAAPPPALEFAGQTYRWKSIQTMAQYFAEEQTSGKRNPYLISVQLLWPHHPSCKLPDQVLADVQRLEED